MKYAPYFNMDNQIKDRANRITFLNEIFPYDFEDPCLSHIEDQQSIPQLIYLELFIKFCFCETRINNIPDKISEIIYTKRSEILRNMFYYFYIENSPYQEDSQNENNQRYECIEKMAISLGAKKANYKEIANFIIVLDTNIQKVPSDGYIYLKYSFIIHSYFYLNKMDIEKYKIVNSQS